jgi:hypothetical protein
MSGVELAVISAIVGGAGALATYRQGQAAQMVEEAKADQAVLQGSIQAANYKAEASQKLKNLEKVLAANTARASAGNISPFTSGDTPALIAAGQLYPMDSFTNPGNYTMFNDMAPGGM